MKRRETTEVTEARREDGGECVADFLQRSAAVNPQHVSSEKEETKNDYSAEP
jgi:hypothetical protein